MSYNEVKLAEVASYISRGITPSYTDADGICVINQKCIRNGSLSLVESRLHNEIKKKVPIDKIVQPMDILVNSTGTGTLGRVAQVICNISATVDSHVTIVRPKKNVNSLFLGYAVKWRQPYIEALAEGSTGQTELSRFRLGDEITIPLPPLEVQQQIAKTLYAIDCKIDTNSKINDNLQQQAQVLYREWFISRFEEHADQYRKVSLADLMDYAGGSQPPASEFITEQRDGYVRFVQIRDYESDSHITYIPISSKNKICEEHDIMIARYGAALGRICFGLNGAYNVALAKVFPKQKYYREFLRCYLSSREFYEGINNKGGRSAQAGFNQSDIRSFELFIPVDESTIQCFESLVAPIFEKRLHIIKENQSLAALRDALLSKLMSGEVDVSSIQF